MINSAALAKIRNIRKMSQREMADHLRVPLKQWQELERGEKELTPSTFSRMVTALEISDDEIPSWKQLAVGNTGVKIRALRKKQGFSLEQLATLTELSATYLSEVERGEKIASFSALRSITEVFQVPISLFVGNKRKQSIVGEKLRAARKDRTMTQQQLAEAAGISTAMVAHLENGKVQASLDTIEKISETLGISVCYLILEQEEVEEMIGAITPEMRDILFDPQVQNIIGSICTFSKEEMTMVLNYVHMIRNPHIKA
nr:helix-turn-helix transcriptional regulator [Anoxynatronum buryatiense]